MASLLSGVTTTCPDLDADTVKEIIDTGSMTDAQINSFINMAYLVTLPLLGNLGECGGNDAECTIMLLLSAHFITMYERQAKSESIAGEWTVSWMGKDGLGLDSSLYGQQAIVLDCSGKLAEAGLKLADLQVIDYETLDDLTSVKDD